MFAKKLRLESLESRRVLTTFADGLTAPAPEPETIDYGAAEIAEYDHGLEIIESDDPVDYSPPNDTTDPVADQFWSGGGIQFGIYRGGW